MILCRLMCATNYGVMHPPKLGKTLNTPRHAPSSANHGPLSIELFFHVTTLGLPFITIYKIFHHHQWHQWQLYRLFCIPPSTIDIKWRTPKFFDGLIASPKVKTTEGERVGAHSLACNTSGVEGHVGVSGWGLGKLTSNSITHTDLHKPNNKLVSALVEHFLCTDEPWANTDSQDSPQPTLGGSHHFPSYNIFCAWPRD
jgi:hypothetical protein